MVEKLGGKRLNLLYWFSHNCSRKFKKQRKIY